MPKGNKNKLKVEKSRKNLRSLVGMQLTIVLLLKCIISGTKNNLCPIQMKNDGPSTNTFFSLSL